MKQRTARAAIAGTPTLVAVLQRMPRMSHLPFATFFAIALAAALPAQSTAVGAYDSASFESPRYQLGTLPGLGFADGQDGWMLFDSLALQPNLAAATVQANVVRSGQRAVRFDAAQLTPHCFGELRRNAMFALTTGVIEIELDFLITSSSTPTDAWEFYTQPAPNPQSAQMRWWIDHTGRVEFLSTPARTLVSTLKFTVSSESMEVPEAQPLTLRLLMMSGKTDTCSGCGGAPTTSS